MLIVNPLGDIGYALVGALVEVLDDLIDNTDDARECERYQDASDSLNALLDSFELEPVDG